MTQRSMHPLAVVAFGLLAAVAAVLCLPTVIGFFDFLLSGDIWRALVAVSLLTLVAGLAIALLIGHFEPRRSRPLWALAWLSILAAPICAVVALVGSGWLHDIVQAIEDLFSVSI